MCYDEISYQHKNIIDPACGETFMSIDEVEIYTFYENLRDNSVEGESFAPYDHNNNDSKIGIYDVRNQGVSDLKNEASEVHHKLNIT